MIQKAIKEFLRKNDYTALNLKGVMFDMDGVLFDSMPFHAKAWHQAMADVNLCFSEYEVFLNEGRTGASTINNQFRKVYNRDSTLEEQQYIYELKSKYFEACGEATPIAFALQLVEKIKKEKLKTVIITGSGEKTMFDRVEKFYPKLFDSIVNAYDVKQGKPNPEPYLKGLGKMNLQANEAIVVENAPLGVEAGVAAEVFTIAVNTGVLQEQELMDAGANLVFPSMQALFESWDEIHSPA